MNKIQKMIKIYLKFITVLAEFKTATLKSGKISEE
jgi:hypothetical protein